MLQTADESVVVTPPRRSPASSAEMEQVTLGRHLPAPGSQSEPPRPRNCQRAACQSVQIRTSRRLRPPVTVCRWPRTACRDTGSPQYLKMKPARAASESRRPLGRRLLRHRHSRVRPCGCGRRLARVHPVSCSADTGASDCLFLLQGVCLLTDHAEER